MLNVLSPIQIGRHKVSMDQETMHEVDEVPAVNENKQQVKKRIFTPTRILLGVAIFCILTFGAYRLCSSAFPQQTKSKVDLSHNKLIQAAESSTGKDSSSNSGSQSSKSSRDSSKPLGVANTVGKSVISSNLPKSLGSSSSSGGGDDEEPSEQDNDGQKRKKQLAKNFKDGSSTQGDSEQQSNEQQEDDSGTNIGQIGIWPNGGGPGNMPLVGNTRN